MARSALVSCLLTEQPFGSKFGEERESILNVHFEPSIVLGASQCHFIFTIALADKNHYGHLMGQEIEI